MLLCNLPPPLPSLLPLHASEYECFFGGESGASSIYLSFSTAKGLPKERKNLIFNLLFLYVIL
jgi:hypothetical protein